MEAALTPIQGAFLPETVAKAKDAKMPTLQFKVLIIDDHEPIRESLMRRVKQAWKSFDYELEITAVSTLAEGAAEASTANVTILDLELPDSSEQETIQKIPLFRRPVIVVTGSIDPMVKLDCLSQGADYVLIKGHLESFIAVFFEALQRDIYRSAKGYHAE